jgi:hypothetical protein
MQYSVYFHSAPIGQATGIMATIDIDSKDLLQSGCSDVTGCRDYATSNTKASIQTALKHLMTNTGKNASGPLTVYHDDSALYNLVTNTGQGATDVIDGQQIVLLPKLNVEGASIDYEQLGANIDCTQRALSPNTM